MTTTATCACVGTLKSPLAVHSEKQCHRPPYGTPVPCPSCAAPTWNGLHRNGHADCVMAEVEVTP